MKLTATGLAVVLIKLASATGDGANDRPLLESPGRSNFAPQPSARILKLFSEEAVNARFKAAAKNKEESRNLKGKFKSAATRAFSVEDIAGPEIAAILDGEPVILSKGASEGAVIFATMAELAQAGCASNDMEDEMIKRGFETEYVWDVLSDDTTMKEQVDDLMMGLAQKEFVESLLEMDDAVVAANEESTDAFGHSSIGPDRLTPSPPKRNKAPKPIKVGVKHGGDGFDEPSEGPGSDLPKPKPKGHGRKLATLPPGCDVQYGSWVGDGYCDKEGGYNTYECNWDGGDCCPMTCVTDLANACGYNGYDCKSCDVEHHHWIGDGYCDPEPYNTADCGYDAGDCCEQTCKDGPEYVCGEDRAYDCKCEPTKFIEADEPHKGRKGPGFKILNDTPWPVEISLWEVAPLYWELVQPGQWFYRPTGGVWFTVHATINMDNEPHISNWDAVWPVLVLIGSVIAAFVTFGESAVLEATLAEALEEGLVAEVKAQVYYRIASTLIGMGMNPDFAMYVTVASTQAAVNVVTSEGVVVTVQETAAKDLFGLQDDKFKVSKPGVYAGTPYPQQKTQAIRVHRGAKFEPAHLNNQCVSVYFRDDVADGARKGRKMKLSCRSGQCGL